VSKKFDPNQYAYLSDEKITFTLGEAAAILHTLGVVSSFRATGLLKPCLNKRQLLLFKRMTFSGVGRCSPKGSSRPHRGCRQKPFKPD
jgi:hypothetical protein